MEKISVLVVEDVSLVAEDIAAKLAKNGITVTGIFSTGEEAIDSLESKIPDLVLMDIHLGGALDGIATAKIIQEQLEVPIIYLTDLVDKGTLDRAKKTFPAHYLAKPFNEADLVRSIELAFSNWQGMGKYSKNILRNHIFVKTDQSHVKLSYDDIIYLEAGRSYCNIVTENGKILQTNPMNYVLDQIGHKDFIRVHRSHVINVNKITEIEGNVIKLGKHTVEMSKGMREELIGKLKFLK